MNFWKKACFRPVIIMLRKVGDGQVVHLVVRLMRECPGLVMVHPHGHRLSPCRMSTSGCPTTAATLAPLLTLWPNRQGGAARPWASILRHCFESSARWQGGGVGGCTAQCATTPKKPRWRTLSILCSMDTCILVATILNIIIIPGLSTRWSGENVEIYEQAQGV